MHKSLLKRIAYLLTIMLIANTIVFLTITYFAGIRTRNLDLEENENLATIYANNIEMKLKMNHQHIYDIAIGIFDLRGVYESSNPLDSFSIKKVCDEMDKKLLVSTDMDAIFAFDTISEQKILRASSYTNAIEIMGIKNEIFEYSKTHYSSMDNATWSIITINDIDYFYDAIYIGKYRVGMLSKLTNFSVDTSVDMMGNHASYFLKYNGKLFFMSGDNDDMEYINDSKKGNRLVVDSASNNKNIQVKSVAKPKSHFWQVETIVILLVVESIVSLLLMLVLYDFTKKQIKQPLERLLIANEQMANGNLDYRLELSKNDSKEFSNIYESYNTMASQIGELKIKQYEMRIQEEQNRLRMLRAQVKPHTFLNGITTISNMTYSQKPETIREYINSFARFARYMLHTSSDMTTVTQELQHIENYVELQRKKSAVNIELNIKCDSDVGNYEIPLLMLYSLVENSFKHSLTSTKDMVIYIQCKKYERDEFKGIMIIEEDNGKGFTEEKLQQLNTMDEQDEYTKEHLGLTNVKYTLNLLYKRNDLLEISNNLEGGARITILIPQKEEEYETTDM